MADKNRLSLELPLGGLPRDCDLEQLAQRARHVAGLMEEVGCYAQDGPVPAHVYQPGELCGDD